MTQPRMRHHALRLQFAQMVGVPHTDGQLLVWTDWAGLSTGRIPRFVKQYADLKGVLAEAARSYKADVQSGSFPTADHSF